MSDQYANVFYFLFWQKLNKICIAALSHVQIYITNMCLSICTDLQYDIYEKQICPCVLSPAKSSPMFDWGLPTALKYSKIQISPICEEKKLVDTSWLCRLLISSSSPGLRIFLLKFSPQHRAAPSSFVWWSAISHRRIYWTIYLQEI